MDAPKPIVFGRKPQPVPAPPVSRDLPDIPGVTGMDAVRRIPTVQEMEDAKKGAIPLRQIDPSKLTQTELDDYAKQGVDVTQLTDMAARVAAYTQKTLNQPIELPKNTPPLTLPPVVKYENASPERQRAMQEVQAGIYTPPPSKPVAPPVTAQADLPTPAPAPLPAPIPPTAPAATPTPVPVDDTAIALCPKCGHNQRQKDLWKPTDAELVLFQQCVYSGKPYEATCSVLNGNVKLKFRRMSSSENDLVIAQVAKEAAQDVREQLVRPSMHYQNLLMSYAMTLCLLEIQTPTMHVVFPPIQERDISSGIPNDVKTAYSDLSESVLASDDLRRTVYAAHLEFASKADRIWEIISRPDFSDAIGLPRF